jgi:hypothetical protein
MSTILIPLALANFYSVASAMQEKLSFAPENQYVTLEIPIGP